MKKIYEEYGFEDIYIVPRQDNTNVTSRKNVDTSISFNGFKFDMPLMLAPMSFFGDVAIRKVENKFLTFLPRIQCHQFDKTRIYTDWSDIDQRIHHAKILYGEGYYFGAAISMREDIEKI